MKKSVIPRDVAEEEVQKWLDYKRISINEDDEEDVAKEKSLVKYFMDGSLCLNHDNFTITQKLKFPLSDEDGEVALAEIVYQPRLNRSHLNAKMKGVKASDVDGRLVGYTAALSGQPKGMLGKLDTEDNKVAQSVVMFFL